MRLALATVILLAGLVAVFVPADARAQGVEENLQALAMDNARLYVQPVATGFGTALNTGFVQTANTHRRFGFDVGIRVMGAFVPDKDLTFVPVLPATVNFGGTDYSDPYQASDGNLLSPTAAGEGPGVRLVPTGDYRNALLLAGENPSNYELTFPEGLNIPLVPFAILQASMGVGFGTDVTLRLIPSVEVDEELGKIGAFGFGVKHSIDQWIPSPLPIALAVSAGWQRFTVGDYLEASASNFALIASRTVGPMTVFGAAGHESSSLDFEYVASNPTNDPGLPPDGQGISFSSASVGGARAAVGLSFKLLLLDLAAEYAVGDYNTASVKLGFTFR